MPNYVTHRVSFEGDSDSINDMMSKISSKDGDETLYIDFNSIIPMPDSLNITSGTSTDIAIAIIEWDEKKEDTKLREMLRSVWISNLNIKTTEELVEYLRKNSKYDIEEGKKALSNLDLYGCMDWYDWSKKNWGTKWNAGSTSYKDGILNFDTAWSTPIKVMTKLSTMFPNIIIKIEFADEDIGSNCGTYTLENGILLNNEKYDIIKACELWGHDPADYCQEIRRDRQIDKIIENDNIDSSMLS